jgi:hypothetical protein
MVSQGVLMKSTQEDATRVLETWRQGNADLRCAFDDKGWSFSCSGRITSTVPVLKLRGEGFEAMLSLNGAEIEYDYRDLNGASQTAPEPSGGEHTVSLTLKLPNSGRVHIVGRQLMEGPAPQRSLSLGAES